jgi:hypothetical protein
VSAGAHDARVSDTFAADDSDVTHDPSDSSDHQSHGHDSDEPHGLCKLRDDDRIVLASPLPSDAAERVWTTDARRRTLHEACEDLWTSDQLADRLAEIDAIAARLATARKQPTKIGCKQVVSTHYADARWKGKLDGFAASAREKMITASRQRMNEACERQAWSDIVRACIVARGGMTCFEASGMGLAWGYPAAGTVTSLGIADCDAYAAAIASITTCNKVPDASRQSLRRSFDEMQAHLASLPAAERARLASSCRAGIDAIRQVASSAGC